MIKRILLFLVLLASLQGTAYAQFDKGVRYVGASISGLGLSYSSSEKFRMGVDLSAGYFAFDCLQLRGDINYTHTRQIDDIGVGVGVRYYFDQCGVFLGTGAEYQHYTPNNNDVRIPLEAGYAFFINRFITIEPSLYYKISLSDFSDKSTFGFKIGLGFYF